MIKSILNQTLKYFGYQIIRSARSKKRATEVFPSFNKIHYGCGYNYLEEWLNVDIIGNGPSNYSYVDLINRHPFPANSFQFGFSEDFIEHIDQASSLMFLEEAHRTLCKGGILRLAFPVLDEVLKKHFTPIDPEVFLKGKQEAFDAFGHIHFYSKESLALVASHIGFQMKVVEYGKSIYPQLDGINTRNSSVNIHVELTKL